MLGEHLILSSAENLNEEFLTGSAALDEVELNNVANRECLAILLNDVKINSSGLISELADEVNQFNTFLRGASLLDDFEDLLEKELIKQLAGMYL